MNFLVKVIKENVDTDIQSMVFPLLLIKILLQTAQLLSKDFSFGFSICILNFL